MIDPFVLPLSNCEKSKGAVVLEIWVGEEVKDVGPGVGESLGGNDGGTGHFIPPYIEDEERSHGDGLGDEFYKTISFGMNSFSQSFIIITNNY